MEQHREDQETPDMNNPYVAMMFGSDTHEEDLQKRIKDRGRAVVMLFLVLFGSVYSNVYQLMQTKVVPFIHVVNDHGEVVTRLLLKPEEIPPDDPLRHALIKNYVDRWVKNARVRSSNVKLTVDGINSALRMAAGPAQAKLSTAVAQEDLFARIKRESVQVNMPKSPVLLAGNTWQAEWEEVVTGASNMEIGRETWTGTFEVAQQANWMTDKNPLGLRVVNWNAAPVRK